MEVAAMTKTKVIQAGVYVQKGDSIRRVGAETGWGFEYIQFYKGEKRASSWSCSDSALRAWGKVISEAEAHALIPNMDEQEATLRQEQRQRGHELAAKLEPAFLASLSDEDLIAECRRRGLRLD
jgi:hypothetical protein